MNVYARAVVAVAEFDYDYEQTTDGRYDHRPYGRYLPSRYPGRYHAAAMTTGTRMTSLAAVALALTTLSVAVL